MMEPTRFKQSQFDLLKESIQLRGTWKARIASGSMEPLIKTGEEIEVIPVENFSSLQRFDILVFFSNSILTCHYLWSRNTASFDENKPLLITRGLNVNWEDFPIREEQILGVVKNKKIPLLAKFRLSLNRRWL